MESFTQNLALIFHWLTKTSLHASVIVCIVIIVKYLLNKRIAPRWHYCLWLLVIARMLMPIAPQSSLSIFNLIPASAKKTAPPEPVTIEKVTQTTPANTSPKTNYSPPPVTENLEKAVISAKSQDTIEKSSPLPNIIKETKETAPAIEQTPSESEPIDYFALLSITWLTGAIVLSLYVIAGNLRLWRIIRRRRPVTDSTILDLLEDCKSQMNIHTYLSVVETEKLSSPALFGFIRPRLLLPKGMLQKLTSARLRHVFLHELAHLKRGDIYLGWLTALLQTIHWFNPMVWYAFHKMRTDRELACDQLALTAIQNEEPNEYGKTIVSLLENYSTSTYNPGLAGILEDRSQLKRRITMITKHKKGSYRFSLLAAFVIAILCAVALTSATDKTPLEEKKADASEFVDLLLNNQFKQATNNFDQKMKRALPPKKLEKAWQETTLNAGLFEDKLGIRAEKYLWSDIIYVTCKFQEGPLDVKVVYDKNKKISGLWFVPVPQKVLDEYAKEPSQSVIDSKEAEIKNIIKQFWAAIEIGNAEEVRKVYPTIPDRFIKGFKEERNRFGEKNGVDFGKIKEVIFQDNTNDALAISENMGERFAWYYLVNQDNQWIIRETEDHLSENGVQAVLKYCREKYSPSAKPKTDDRKTLIRKTITDLWKAVDAGDSAAVKSLLTDPILEQSIVDQNNTLTGVLQAAKLKHKYQYGLEPEKIEEIILCSKSEAMAFTKFYKEGMALVYYLRKTPKGLQVCGIAENAPSEDIGKFLPEFREQYERFRNLNKHKNKTKKAEDKIKVPGTFNSAHDEKAVISKTITDLWQAVDAGNSTAMKSLIDPVAFQHYFQHYAEDQNMNVLALLQTLKLKYKNQFGLEPANIKDILLCSDSEALAFTKYYGTKDSGNNGLAFVYYLMRTPKGYQVCNILDFPKSGNISEILPKFRQQYDRHRHKIIPSEPAGAEDKLKVPGTFNAAIKGITVELLGIYDLSAGSEKWWSPHRYYLAENPYNTGKSKAVAKKGQKVYEFALKFSGLEKNHNIKVEKIMEDFTKGENRKYIFNQKTGKYDCWYNKSFSYDENQKYCDLSVGVETDQWQTVAEHNGDGTLTESGSQDIVLSKAMERDGKTYINITHQIKNHTSRVIAVDKSGKIHEKSRQSKGGNKFIQVNAEFDLPLDKIQTFILQRRAIVWTTLRNIPLAPANWPTLDQTVKPAVQYGKSSLTEKLPSGGEILFTGVCKLSEPGKPWYTPSGSTQVDPGHISSQYTAQAGKKAYHFKIQCQSPYNKIKKGAKVDWNFKPNPSSVYGFGGDWINGVHNLTYIAEFPKDIETVDLTFKISNGPWKTVAVNQGKDSTVSIDIDGTKKTVEFKNIRETGGRTYLEIIHPVRELAHQLIAYNKYGKMHHPSRYHEQEYGKVEVRFDSLKLDDIDRLEFKTQQIDTVLFKNISLKTGLVTKPEVKTKVQGTIDSTYSDDPLPTATILEFRIVAEMSPEKAKALSLPNADIDGYKWMPIKSGRDLTMQKNMCWHTKNNTTYLLVSCKENESITADGTWGIEKSGVKKGPAGNPAIYVCFDNPGSKKLEKLTSNNINRYLAVCIDGKVYSTPKIMSKFSKSTIITGGFTESDAQKLADTLKKGMLPKKSSAPDPQGAEKMIAPLYGLFSASYETLMKENNPKKALSIIETALPQLDTFAAKLKGTDIETSITMAVDQVRQIAKAIKDGDTDKAKGLMEAINTAGPKLQEMVEKTAKKTKSTANHKYDLTKASDFVRKTFDEWKTEVRNDYLLKDYKIKQEHVLEGKTGAVAYVWFSAMLKNVKTNEDKPFEAVYFLYRWHTDHWEGIFNTDGTGSKETPEKLDYYKNKWLPSYLEQVEQGYTRRGSSKKRKPPVNNNKTSTVEPDKDNVGLDSDADKAHLEIKPSLKIRGKEASPRCNVRLYDANKKPVRTLPSDQLFYTNLKPGKYIVEVYFHESATTETRQIELTAGQEKVLKIDAVTDQRATIELVGKILSQETGQPLKDIYFDFNQSQGTRIIRAPARTKADGLFSIKENRANFQNGIMHRANGNVYVTMQVDRNIDEEAAKNLTIHFNPRLKKAVSVLVDPEGDGVFCDGINCVICRTAKKVTLPDLETEGAKTVLDLATGLMFSAAEMERDRSYFDKKRQGDIVYDYAGDKSALLCLRGATMQIVTDSGPQPTEPDVKRSYFNGYFINQTPCRYQLTTKDGQNYDIKIVSMNKGDKGNISIEFCKSSINSFEKPKKTKQQSTLQDYLGTWEMIDVKGKKASEVISAEITFKKDGIVIAEFVNNGKHGIDKDRYVFMNNKMTILGHEELNLYIENDRLIFTEDNSQFTFKKKSTPAEPANSLPDISIENITAAPYPEGGLYQVTAAIKNNGTAPAGQFAVHFCREGKKPLKHPAGPIEPGKTWNERSMPFALKDGTNTITVKIDPDNKIKETNENNNTKTIQIKINETTSKPLQKRWPLNSQIGLLAKYCVTDIIDEFDKAYKNHEILSDPDWRYMVNLDLASDEEGYEKVSINFSKNYQTSSKTKPASPKDKSKPYYHVSVILKPDSDDTTHLNSPVSKKTIQWNGKSDTRTILLKPGIIKATVTVKTNEEFDRKAINTIIDKHLIRLYRIISKNGGSENSTQD